MKTCFSLLVLITIACGGRAQGVRDTICILQLNDVYEIGPLNEGKSGGMARVATIVKQHQLRYQTFVVLAGDFVSPSVIGTTRINGQKVNGRHMVDMMNKAGVNLVTFGNHEFDIPEADLQQRMNESRFTWLGSNVLHRLHDSTVVPFYKTVPDTIATPTSFVLASTHNQFSVGFVSATIGSNRQPWVVYNDYLRGIKNAWKQVHKKTDIVVALTHLTLAEDDSVLHAVKKIRLIMGGHEHRHHYVTVGNSAIAKADANAKTMYRHLVFREGRRGRIRIVSELLNVDSLVIPDAETALAVTDWEDKAYAAFKAIGLDPQNPVYHTTIPLDGTETSNRYRQTNLGSMIAQAMRAASPGANAAVFNSGSIRIDDMIDGVLTQLDIIRTLPFGGKLCEIDLTGELLVQLLTTGNKLKGEGGYLQLSTNLSFDGTSWLLDGIAINPAGIYTIVSPEFLFTGAEKGLEFLKEGNPGIKEIRRFTSLKDVRTDIRLAVVKYLISL